MKIVCRVVLILSSLLWAGWVQSASFILSDIRLEGLQRLNPEQAFADLPLVVGDTVDERMLAYVTRSLFKSGNYQDITLVRDGDVLVIQLKERPAIVDIQLTGNKLIKTEVLLESLASVGLKPGEILRHASLEQIELELERQYKGQGKYTVLVESRLTEMDENRVAIEISINEGVNSVISQINIVGNEYFSDAELIDLMQLQTTHFWTLFSKSDRYSREKLAADIETIRSHYLDRGFVKFNVESTQVSISPDKTQVYINISLFEGPLYTIGDLSVSGDLVLPQEQIMQTMAITTGQVFSRKQLVAASQAVRQAYGDKGYAFAQVKPIPLLDEDRKSVDIKVQIESGKRTYVRRINFRGNTRTSDEVMRREMRQMEGSIASFADIEASKLRLQRLGFFNNVDIKTVPVVGTDDLLDVEVEVVEGLTSNWSISLGYVDGEGPFWGAAIAQDNFLGTGNAVDASFTNSKSTDNYRFSYTDPYYSVDGLSLGFDIFYNKRDYSAQSISDFSTNTYGSNIRLGYPIADVSSLDFSLGFENIDLQLPTSYATEIGTFVSREGLQYNQLKGKVSWTHNDLDQYWFPTDGSSQQLSFEVALPGSDLNYYQLGYNYRMFNPITDNLVLSAAVELAYNDAYSNTSDSPFFRNYYVGGISTLRGFSYNSVGPRDSSGNPLGGQILTTARTELVFPFPGLRDTESVRTLVFLDVANTFTRGQFNMSDLRASAGVSFSWLTPIGPLSLVLARPVRKQSGDITERMHIALGNAY
jgi:outer membrane protein insertion porin family